MSIHTEQMTIFQKCVLFYLKKYNELLQKQPRKMNKMEIEMFKNLLPQAELVINLLFMQDFSYLVAACSKYL